MILQERHPHLLATNLHLLKPQPERYKVYIWVSHHADELFRFFVKFRFIKKNYNEI